MNISRLHIYFCVIYVVNRFYLEILYKTLLQLNIRFVHFASGFRIFVVCFHAFVFKFCFNGMRAVLS